MKKLLPASIVAFTFICFLSLAYPVQAQNVAVSEEISAFDAAITVQADSSLIVQETITYDFGTNLRHGIIRSIPYSYETKSGAASIDISNISVTDERRLPYEYSVTRDGKILNIKIGSPSVTVHGTRVYIISYTVEGAVGYFADHDELYWNVTGSEWHVPIQQASATIKILQPIASTSWRLACYAGVVGAITSCSNQQVQNDTAQSSAVYFNQGLLRPGQGLTVVAGFPKGIVQEPSHYHKLLKHWEFGIPLALLVAWPFLWFRKRKNERGTGVIIPQYEPPDSLTPAQVGTLIDGRAQNRDVSAEVIYLAVSGYLKIRGLKKTGLMSHMGDYELTQLKEVDEHLTQFDADLLEAVSSYDGTKLSHLSGKFGGTLTRFTNDVYNSLIAKGYFVNSPRVIRNKYQYIGAVVGLAGFVLIGVTEQLVETSWWAIALLLSGVLVYFFSYLMPRWTKQGALVRESILGFKLYLTVAEKDRLAFHDAPEKTPEQFERFLPYAIALGVEKAWARQFEGIYQASPSWYNDSSNSVFNALYLAHTIHGFSNHSNGALGASPLRSGAAAGFSGLGGGGFSGGGFGGGGGGSW